MANSHFFINTSSSATQNKSEAFGPVSGNETTQYRVTSKFSNTGDTPAYATFTGQVFLQPSSETGKVNLILRPYRQPFLGLAVKYFIYRGLKKIDFIPSGDEDLISFDQKDSASEFIKIIWNQLVSFDNEASAKSFKAKWIGYDPDNQTPDSLIDDYFFLADAYGDDNNETLKPFEFPIIPKGTFLGNFTGKFGLDVVLSDGDYKSLTSTTGFEFNLAYARASESIINTSQIPEGYIEKQYREAISHFIDPAAFWGLHLTEKSDLKVNDGTTVTTLEKQQVYDKVVSRFFTKNKVYIHVQGHLGRSYNFYDTYKSILDNDEVVKLGVELDNTTSFSYPENGWPVIIQEQSQSHDKGINAIHLQLIYDLEGKPLLFGQIGVLDEKAENNFLTSEQLIPEITVSEENDVVLDSYTTPITMLIPATGSASAKSNIASYVKLIYKGATLKALDAAGVEQPVKSIDTLFGPVNIEQRLASANEEVISWCFSNIYNLIDISEVKSNNASKVATQTKIIYDRLSYENAENLEQQSRVIYETQLIKGIGEGVLDRSNSITSSTNAGKIPFSKEDNNSYKLAPPYQTQVDIFSNNNETITGLKIGVVDEQTPPDKFILGLDLIESSLIKNKIIENNFKNSSIFFYENEEELSGELKKYTLKVLGETQNGTLTILDVQEDLTIFSIDSLYFFTKKFSERVSLEEDNILIPDFTL